MSFYYGAPHQHHLQQQQSSNPSHHNQQQHNNSNNNNNNNHNHHGGRSRRGPRLSSQNSHRQFRGVRSMKELADAPVVSAFRLRFEACKGFDLDDDLEFCPGLLTEDDLQSIHSSSSDRSSLSSGSPSGSPLQHQTQPTQQVSPPFSLAQTFQPTPSYQHSQPQLKMHQPSAVRTRNAIPIVNPSTGMRVSSPPPSSVSPARMQQYGRRW